jgi:hypothetical protein
VHPVLPPAVGAGVEGVEDEVGAGVLPVFEKVDPIAPNLNPLYLTYALGLCCSMTDGTPEVVGQVPL